MATRDPRTPVHTDTQVLAETPLAGKEVGPSGAWAGPAHPSARGAPSCSDHALCPQPSAANPAAPRPRPAPHSSESSTYVPTSPWPVLLGLCLSPPDAAAEGPALRTPTRCSPRRFPSCLDPHLLSRSWRPLVSTLRAPLLPAVGVRGSRALCGPDSPRSPSFTGIKLHPPATNLKGKEGFSNSGVSSPLTLPNTLPFLWPPAQKVVARERPQLPTAKPILLPAAAPPSRPGRCKPLLLQQ